MAARGSPDDATLLDILIDGFEKNHPRFLEASRNFARSSARRPRTRASTPSAWFGYPRKVSESREVGSHGRSVIRGKVFLELEDVRAALATSPEVRTFRIVLIVVSLAAVAFVRRTAVEFGASPSAVAGVSAVAGAFCAVTLLLARWRAPRRMLERMTREERELRFEFSESGYVITRGASRAESAWPGVRRIVEGPESFQLSLQLKGGQIVPKRAFADSDVSRLRELFARHAKSQ